MRRKKPKTLGSRCSSSILVQALELEQRGDRRDSNTLHIIQKREGRDVSDLCRITLSAGEDGTEHIIPTSSTSPYVPWKHPFLTFPEPGSRERGRRQTRQHPYRIHSKWRPAHIHRTICTTSKDPTMHLISPPQTRLLEPGHAVSVILRSAGR